MTSLPTINPLEATNIGCLWCAGDVTASTMEGAEEYIYNYILPEIMGRVYTIYQSVSSTNTNSQSHTTKQNIHLFFIN